MHSGMRKYYVSFCWFLHTLRTVCENSCLLKVESRYRQANRFRCILQWKPYER